MLIKRFLIGMVSGILFFIILEQTLLMDLKPKLAHLGIAALLALLVFPLGLQFSEMVKQLYPVTDEVEFQMTELSGAIDSAPYAWLPFLLIAALPALCEELAFRGYILSGLRHTGHKWWAIGISAVAFGMVHFFLQQKISAAAVGLILGYLAVQTGSLLPCIVFHAIYNGLAVAIGKLSEETTSQWSWLFSSEGETLFQPEVMIVCLLGVGCLCWMLHRIPYRRTAEEQLNEAREQQLAGA